MPPHASFAARGTYIAESAWPNSSSAGECWYAPATGTVWGRAVWRDARDGGVETGEGVHVFDGEVRAERDARAVVDDAPEGVEALDALGALSDGDVSVCEVRVLV